MTDSWKERLLLAVKRDGRSARKISRAAGLGPNFVSQLRRADKEPSMENVLKLAAELKVSLAYVFMGRDDISAEDEQILDILRHKTLEERKAFLTVLGGKPDPQKG